MSGLNSALPLVKDKKHSQGEADFAYAVIPFQFFAEIGDGKNSEGGKCNDFLDCFELCCVEFVGSDAVGGNLKAVFKERDAPTGNYDLRERFAAVFEVPRTRRRS